MPAPPTQRSRIVEKKGKKTEEMLRETLQHALLLLLQNIKLVVALPLDAVHLDVLPGAAGDGVKVCASVRRPQEPSSSAAAAAAP
jgi:hypothetical protein